MHKARATAGAAAMIAADRMIRQGATACETEARF